MLRSTQPTSPAGSIEAADTLAPITSNYHANHRIHAIHVTRATQLNRCILLDQFAQLSQFSEFIQLTVDLRQFSQFVLFLERGSRFSKINFSAMS